MSGINDLSEEKAYRFRIGSTLSPEDFRVDEEPASVLLEMIKTGKAKIHDSVVTHRVPNGVTTLQKEDVYFTIVERDGNICLSPCDQNIFYKLTQVLTRKESWAHIPCKLSYDRSVPLTMYGAFAKL